MRTGWISLQKVRHISYLLCCASVEQCRFKYGLRELEVRLAFSILPYLWIRSSSILFTHGFIFYQELGSSAVAVQPFGHHRGFFNLFFKACLHPGRFCYFCYFKKHFMPSFHPIRIDFSRVVIEAISVATACGNENSFTYPKNPVY